jgi:hypothetical protein
VLCRRLSYGHREHGRSRTCLSGFAGRRLAARLHARFAGHSRTFLQKRAVQGSNLPPPDLESGIPPLKNFRRTFSRHCVERDSNPRRPLGASGSTDRRICRSATYAFYAPINQRGRIRTFDPVRPRHVRYQAALHAVPECGTRNAECGMRNEMYIQHSAFRIPSSAFPSLLPGGIEPRVLRLKAGRPAIR